MDARRNLRSRGAGWVPAQFAIMLALLAVAPVWRGQWTNLVTVPLAVALGLAGAWLGLAGVRVLGVNRTPFPEPRDGSRLVTSGIYSRVRHPLYASVMALGFAWSLLWQSWPGLAVAVAQAAFFHAKAQFEERLLRERFAEYADYAGRVPRFLPRVHFPARPRR